MKFLRKTYVILTFFSMLLLVFCYCSPFPFSKNQEGVEPEVIKSVRTILEHLHYAPQEMNDAYSEKVYDSYLESLDSYKNYFKQTDIDHFSQYRDQLDDFFEDENLIFYNQSIDTLYRRMGELDTLSQKLLKHPFDYNKKETLTLDFDASTYPKDKAEWENKWRKRLKHNVLQEILILEESAKDSAYWAKEDSIGIGKDTFDPRNKSFAELEKEARKNVKENMSDYFRRFQKRKKSDWFSIYVNAFTREFDPHTNYFSPKENEDFETSMSGQLEGIGATLKDDKGFPTIVDIITGGPAWKQGDLEVEDKITKVAQEGEDPVNVQGMLLEDAIRLIRGKKGTVVTLTVKKKDGSFKQIPIERDIVEISETFARSAIVTDEKGDRYGIIYLPSFYLNYDGKGHDASDDVKKQIEELKKAKIKGLVFDLRNNGGGDLSECVEIVGHFIPQGPVVQVRRSDGQQKEYKDEDRGQLQWDGPMVVMVNELSASASEIMAAALQDYNRAVIVGSPKTYGKGTVQTVRPLSYFFNSDDKYGALKFTIQKFYRINGGSTQLKGVRSDIVIPDRYTYLDISEGSQKSSLPWDQIQPSTYTTWKKPINIAKLQEKSKARLGNKKQIKELESYAKWMKQIEDDKTIALNYEDFKRDFKEKEKKSKKYDNLTKYKNGLKVTSPKYEEALMKNDTVLKKRRETWHKNLGKDIYLEESIEVLKDIR